MRVDGEVAFSGLLANVEKHLACLHTFGGITRKIESSIMVRFLGSFRNKIPFTNTVVYRGR